MEYGRHVGQLLRRRLRARPRAIPLALITMRKLRFSFLSRDEYGAPSPCKGCRSSAITFFTKNRNDPYHLNSPRNNRFFHANGKRSRKGCSVFLVETSHWKFVSHLQSSRLYHHHQFHTLSRSFKRPGLLRLPLNGTCGK